MCVGPHAPPQSLKQQRGLPAPIEASETRPEAEDVRDPSRRLACALCKRDITSNAARIAVDGRHEHTFANPYGFVFRIGCFAAAVGVVAVGPVSGEFAWFAGHTWQIEQCASCGAHLGWIFRSATGSFHGLVLDSLVEIEEGE